MSKKIPKTITSFEHNYYLDEDVFKMVNKLEQENKQLKEKYENVLIANRKLIKEIDDYQNIIIKMKEENKQLKEEIDLQFKDLMKRIQENNDEYLEEKNKLIKENYHYRKILTELEKWLKEETIELYDKDNPMLLDQSYITYATERKMAYMYILDKIQELKEKYK